MRSPYPGFTPLNRRRSVLIHQKHQGGGLDPDEARELAMLQTVVGALLDYRYPRDDTVLRRTERRAAKLRGARRP